MNNCSYKASGEYVCKGGVLEPFSETSSNLYTRCPRNWVCKKLNDEQANIACPKWCVNELFGGSGNYEYAGSWSVDGKTDQCLCRKKANIATRADGILSQYQAGVECPARCTDPSYGGDSSYRWTNSSTDGVCFCTNTPPPPPPAPAKTAPQGYFSKYY